MATAKDIAEKLGVSLSAVSIALNGKPGISDDTRKKILDAAQEMGYRKRPWNERTPGVIQLLVFLGHPNHSKIFDANPFFARVIEGMSKRCQELGYSMQIAYVNETDLDAKNIGSFIVQSSVGVLVLASSMPESKVNMLHQLPLPVVVVDNDYPKCKVDSVSIDNYYAISAIMEHLISLGHANLCFAGLFDTIPNTAVRANAFLSIVREHPELAVSLNNPIIISHNMQGSLAADELRAAIEKLETMPTAFVCSNDWVASACIYALNALGYKVPQDVSVTGFDNIPLSEMMTPSITTVDIPKARIGILAVNRLAEMVGGSNATVKSFVLSDLVVRESTAPVRK